MKHLERTPATLRPPDPAAILQNLPWLSGLDREVVDTILTYAEFLQLEQSDSLLEEGMQSRGIYVIVSGLVKVCMSLWRRVGLHTSRYKFHSSTGDNEYRAQGVCSAHLH